jgi:pSer/pThr/pTyr-binding forkhead associated (FHA) protein
MPLDNILFMAKFIFLGLIYLFLIQVLAVIRADIRGFAKKKARRGSAAHGIEILSGEDALEASAGHVFPLTAGSLTFGRDDSNDIRIFDASVSNTHARLSLEGNTCSIEDMGSKNGTFVNERRIESATLLKKGDIIRIGMATLRYLGDS